MLNLNPDIVCAIIEKCHEFHGQEGVSIPHNSEDYDDDWAMQVLADHTDDSTFQELKYLIDDLEPSHQVELVALMWMGRGDYAIDEWQDAIKQAYDSWNSRTAEYLLGSPLVADYLQEALQEMGYQCGE